MKTISKLYTAIIMILTSLIFISLSAASFGMIIKHPSLAYFWYLALGGIAMVLATSFVIGIVLVLDRSIKFLRRVLRILFKPTVEIS